VDLSAGELYFVREVDPDTKKYTKFVKIGLVNEREGRGSLNRLSEHQTGNPRTLSLPAGNYFVSPAINRIEAMMHKVFASNRVSGEWFEFETEKQVLAAIKKAKELAAEVVDQIPTFTKAEKLGQSHDNGKVISPTPETEKILRRIAVARVKKKYLSEISVEVAAKLKLALDKGLNVEGAAKEVRVNRKGKFNLELFSIQDPKTYKKYLVTTQSLSARLTLAKVTVNVEDLDEAFQSLVRQLRSTAEKSKKNDFRTLNEVQLQLTNEIATAEWDEEFALAELKLACGKNRSIKDICTWKRDLVEKVSFDEKAFKLKNPIKYEQYLEEPNSTSYVKVSKRKI
jgi:hypothetical protein